MNRRTFLSQAKTAAAGLAVAGPILGNRRAAGNVAANDRITIAMMGVRGRGGSVLNTFAACPNVEVKYICDIDENTLRKRTGAVAEKTGKRPTMLKDFRRALDDPAVDALVIGTPDHWHAIPTILACQAGKDVYVEKPDGHNVLEGRTMVAAAKKYERIVQLGTQGRSGTMHREAMAYIRAGHLGRALSATAWESACQGAIRPVPDSQPPAGVDYDLWLGPAPKRAFNARRFHGSWRWFFDYGTGDLGNDGVHRLDNAKWALDTAIEAAGGRPIGLPRRVFASGGKYYFDDAQEWPDTLMVTYDYPGYILTYEMRVWTPYPLHGESEGAAVFGDKGYIVIGNRRWRAFGAKDKLLAQGHGDDNTVGHVRNFLDCMHTRHRPAADLETVGHPSSMLCHLGNAAWRTGRALAFDPETNRFKGDSDADQYLTRPKYREPWTLPDINRL